jgi:hypothetical protein
MASFSRGILGGYFFEFEIVSRSIRQREISYIYLAKMTIALNTKKAIINLLSTFK